MTIYIYYYDVVLVLNNIVIAMSLTMLFKFYRSKDSVIYLQRLAFDNV